MLTLHLEFPEYENIHIAKKRRLEKGLERIVIQCLMDVETLEDIEKLTSTHPVQGTRN